MPDNRKLLYQALKDKNLYSKSEDEFNTQFSTPESQEQLYGAMQKKGLYTKSADEFKTQFFETQPLKDPLQEQSAPTPVEDGPMGTAELSDTVNKQNEVKPEEKQGRLSSFLGTVDQQFYGLPGELLKEVAIGGSKIGGAISGEELNAQDNPLYKAGQLYQDWIAEIAPNNPEYQGELQESVAAAMGDLAGLATGGGVARAATKTPQIVLMAKKLGIPVAEAAKNIARGLLSPEGFIGATQMGVSEYEQAKEAGATDKESFDVFVKNSAVGSVLERMPVQLFWKRLDEATGGGVKMALKKGLSGGIEEGTTEIMQQAYSNKTASEVYDETRTIIDGMGEAGTIGFGLGFALNAMGVKLRGIKKEAKTPEDVAVIEKAEELVSKKQLEIQTQTEEVEKITTQEEPKVTETEVIQPETQPEEQVTTPEVVQPETAEEQPIETPISEEVVSETQPEQQVIEPPTQTTKAIPILSGDTFKTESGRVTAPYPKYSTKRTTKPDTIKANQWLIDEYLAEATHRNDKYNITLAKGMRADNFSTSDSQGANAYIFGENYLEGNIGELKTTPTETKSESAPQEEVVPEPVVETPAEEQITPKEVPAEPKVEAKQQPEGKKITGSTLSKDAFNNLKRKSDDLFLHARNMRSKWGSMEKAEQAYKDGLITKEDVDEWKEALAFNEKHDLPKYHEDALYDAIKNKEFVSKEAFADQPQIVKRIRNEIESGTVYRAIAKKHLDPEYFNMLYENTGIKEIFSTPNDRTHRDWNRELRDQVAKIEGIIKGGIPETVIASEIYPELKVLEEDLGKIPAKKDRLNIPVDAAGEIFIKSIEKKAPSKPVETNKALINVASKDDMRPSMTGIYYDVENQQKVTTDGHALVVIPEKLSGKSRIISKDGREIDDKYPQYMSVIPKGYSKVIEAVNLEQLLNIIRGQAKARKFYDNGDKTIPSIITTKDGVEYGIDPAVAERGLTALLETGTKTVDIEMDTPNRALVFRDTKNSKKYALIMPVMLTNYVSGGNLTSGDEVTSVYTTLLNDQKSVDSKKAPEKKAPAKKAVEANVEPVTKGVRFEKGSKLTDKQKRDVYKTMKDAYKVNNRPRIEINDRYEWAENATDYMVDSDITGRKLRWHITLPDGTIAHPTELFPNITKSEIDVVQANIERNSNESNHRYQRTVEALAKKKQIKSVVDAINTALKNGATLVNEYDSNDIGEANPQVYLRFGEKRRLTVPEYMLNNGDKFIDLTEDDLNKYRAGDHNRTISSDQVDWNRFMEEFGDKKAEPKTKLPIPNKTKIIFESGGRTYRDEPYQVDPNGDVYVDHFGSPRKIKAGDYKIIAPDGTIPQESEKPAIETKVELQEGTPRLYETPGEGLNYPVHGTLIKGTPTFFQRAGNSEGHTAWYEVTQKPDGSWGPPSNRIDAQPAGNTLDEAIKNTYKAGEEIIPVVPDANRLAADEQIAKLTEDYNNEIKDLDNRIVLEDFEWVPREELKGKEVTMDVEIIETGVVEKVKYNAMELQDELRDRHERLKKLTDCVG